MSVSSLVMLLLTEEPEDSDDESGVRTEGSACSIELIPPGVSLEPTELKALFVRPPVRKDHLLVGFSALLAGLYL